MHEGLSVLWMYEPDNIPARQDMDLSTADYYCGLWKLESLLDHLAQEGGAYSEAYSGSNGSNGTSRRVEKKSCELFELQPWMIVKES